MYPDKNNYHLYSWTARASVFLHDRAFSCRIRDAQVLPIYASSCSHLYSSMHDKWVQILEQMLWAAHKIFRRTTNVISTSLLFIFHKGCHFILCLQLHGYFYAAGVALGWWLDCTKEQLMGNLLGSIESTAHLGMAVLRNWNPPHSCSMQEPKIELIGWLYTL